MQHVSPESNHNYSSHNLHIDPAIPLKQPSFTFLMMCIKAVMTKLSILTSLDLSAAFDTLNRNILIVRHNFEFGIEGLALKWLEAYLTGRKRFVKLGTHTSSTVSIEHGVPQGSVLGPLLFTTYPSPIGSNLNKSNLACHQMILKFFKKPILTTPSITQPHLLIASNQSKGASYKTNYN